MKCPQCSLSTSDHRDSCPQCGLDLRGYKERLGIRAKKRPSASFDVPDQAQGTAGDGVQEYSESAPGQSFTGDPFEDLTEAFDSGPSLEDTRRKRRERRFSSAPNKPKEDVADLISAFEQLQTGEAVAPKHTPRRRDAEESEAGWLGEDELANDESLAPLEAIDDSLSEHLDEAKAATAALHDHFELPASPVDSQTISRQMLAQAQVSPEVLDFSEADELLEEKLDEMIGDIVFDVEAVKVQKPKKPAAPEQMMFDDVEISFEIEVEDDSDPQTDTLHESVEVTSSDSGFEEAAEPVYDDLAAADAPFADEMLSEEDDEAGILGELISSFESLQAQTSQRSITPEAPPEPAQAPPPPRPAPAAEQFAAPQQLSKEQRIKNLPESVRATLRSATKSQDPAIERLAALLAEAYGVKPEDLVESDSISSLQDELASELDALMQEGTSFLASKEGSPAAAEPVAPAVDPKIAMLEHELLEQLDALQSDGMSFLGASIDSGATGSFKAALQQSGITAAAHQAPPAAPAAASQQTPAMPFKAPGSPSFAALETDLEQELEMLTERGTTVHSHLIPQPPKPAAAKPKASPATPSVSVNPGVAGVLSSLRNAVSSYDSRGPGRLSRSAFPQPSVTLSNNRTTVPPTTSLGAIGPRSLETAKESFVPSIADELHAVSVHETPKDDMLKTPAIEAGRGVHAEDAYVATDDPFADPLMQNLEPSSPKNATQSLAESMTESVIEGAPLPEHDEPQDISPGWLEAVQTGTFLLNDLQAIEEGEPSPIAGTTTAELAGELAELFDQLSEPHAEADGGDSSIDSDDLGFNSSDFNSADFNSADLDCADLDSLNLPNAGDSFSHHMFEAEQVAATIDETQATDELFEIPLDEAVPLDHSVQTGSFLLSDFQTLHESHRNSAPVDAPEPASVVAEALQPETSGSEPVTVEAVEVEPVDAEADLSLDETAAEIEALLQEHFQDDAESAFENREELPPADRAAEIVPIELDEDAFEHAIAQSVDEELSEFDDSTAFEVEADEHAAETADALAVSPADEMPVIETFPIEATVIEAETTEALVTETQDVETTAVATQAEDAQIVEVKDEFSFEPQVENAPALEAEVEVNFAEAVVEAGAPTAEAALDDAAQADSSPAEESQNEPQDLAAVQTGAFLIADFEALQAALPFQELPSDSDAAAERSIESFSEQTADGAEQPSDEATSATALEDLPRAAVVELKDRRLEETVQTGSFLAADLANVEEPAEVEPAQAEQPRPRLNETVQTGSFLLADLAQVEEPEEFEVEFDVSSVEVEEVEVAAAVAPQPAAETETAQSPERLEDLVQTGSFLLGDFQALEPEQSSKPVQSRYAERKAEPTAPAEPDVTANSLTGTFLVADFAGLENQTKEALEAAPGMPKPVAAVVHTGTFLVQDLKKLDDENSPQPEVTAPEITEAEVTEPKLADSELAEQEIAPASHAAPTAAPVAELQPVAAANAWAASVAVPAELWSEVSSELVACEQILGEEIELGVGNLAERRVEPRILVLFDAVEEELIDPSKRKRHETVVPTSATRVVESSSIKSAVRKFEKEQVVFAQTMKQRAEDLAANPQPLREVHGVPFLQRAGATVADTFVALGLGLLCSWGLFLSGDAVKDLLTQGPFTSPVGLQFGFKILLATYLTWLISNWMMVATLGRSLGGKLFKLEVVLPNGGAPGFKYALLRSLSQSVTLLTFGAGMLSALGSKRVALHDWLSGTRVVEFEEFLELDFDTAPSVPEEYYLDDVDSQ